MAGQVPLCTVNLGFLGGQRRYFFHQVMMVPLYCSPSRRKAARAVSRSLNFFFVKMSSDLPIAIRWTADARLAAVADSYYDYQLEQFGLTDFSLLLGVRRADAADRRAGAVGPVQQRIPPGALPLAQRNYKV